MFRWVFGNKKVQVKNFSLDPTANGQRLADDLLSPHTGALGVRGGESEGEVVWGGGMLVTSGERSFVSNLALSAYTNTSHVLWNVTIFPVEKKNEEKRCFDKAQMRKKFVGMNNYQFVKHQHKNVSEWKKKSVWSNLSASRHTLSPITAHQGEKKVCI